jgi:hypothetical protein
MGQYGIGTRLLCFLLALSLAAPANLVLAASNSEPGNREPEQVDTQLAEAHAHAAQDAKPSVDRLNRFIDELAHSADGSLPTAKDTFHLLNQSLILTDDGRTTTYSLSAFDVSRPTVGGVRRDLVFRIDENTHELVFSRSRLRGHEGTEHRIGGLHFVHALLDGRGETLILMTADGGIYAIDYLTAQVVAFNAPMPLVRVGSVDVHGDRATGGFRTAEDLAQHVARLRLEFLTVGSLPTSLENAQLVSDSSQYLEDGRLRSGDLLVRKQDGSALALFDREALLLRLQKGLFYLLAMIQSADPDFGKESALVELHRSFSEVIGNDAESIVNVPRTTLEREALSNIQLAAGTDFWNRVAAAPGQGHGLSGARAQARHRFTFEEWQRFHASLISQTNQQSVSTEAAWNNYLKGEYTASGERRQPNKTTFMDRLRNKLNARSLKNAAYKIATSPALWVSAGLIGADQFLFNGTFFTTISHLAYEAIYPDIWNEIQYRWPLVYSIGLQSLEIAAIYGIGALLVKVIDRAKITNERIVNRIMSISLKTFAVFQYPLLHLMARVTRQFNLFPALKNGHWSTTALNSPLLGSETQAARTQALNDEISKKKRLASYARTIAYLTAAEETGIDPATLMVAPQSVADQRSLAQFEARWQLVAHEVYTTLLDAADRDTLEMDFASATPVDVAKFKSAITQHYDEAKRTAARLNAGGRRGAYHRLVASARMKWHNITRRSVPQFLYKFFGPDMFQTLWHAKPDAFVSSTTWRQFVIDYGFAIPVQLLWGDRANPADPENLGVRPDFPYTSAPMIADNQEQVLIYLLRSPAENYLVFNSQPASFDGVDPYGVADRVELDESNEHVQGFGAGFAQFMRTAADLRRAQYGTYVARKYNKVWSTLQGRMAMGTPLRVLIGAKALGAAFFAQLQATMMGMWAYGWPWPILIRALQMYEGDVAAEYGKFKNAQIQLAEGIRLGDDAQAQGAATVIRSMYTKAHRGVRQMLTMVLREDFGTTTLEQLSSRDLLALSQKVPPVPKKSNSLVSDFVTWVGGAIPTTVMAVTLLNQLYSPGFTEAPVTYLALGAVKAVGLYATVIAGQAAFNWIYDRSKSLVSRCKTKLSRTKNQAQ